MVNNRNIKKSSLEKMSVERVERQRVKTELLYVQKQQTRNGGSRDAYDGIENFANVGYKYSFTAIPNNDCTVTV